jgi:hypothetical protein
VQRAQLTVAATDVEPRRTPGRSTSVKWIVIKCSHCKFLFFSMQEGISILSNSLLETQVWLQFKSAKQLQIKPNLNIQCYYATTGTKFSLQLPFIAMYLHSSL